MTDQVYRVIARQENKKIVYSPVELVDLPDEIKLEMEQNPTNHIYLTTLDTNVILFSKSKESFLSFIYGLTFATTKWSTWFDQKGVHTFNFAE